jgi:hypothetical protein
VAAAIQAEDVGFCGFFSMRRSLTADDECKRTLFARLQRLPAAGERRKPLIDNQLEHMKPA